MENKIKKYISLCFGILISMLVLLSCDPPEPVEFKATPYQLQIPKYFPTNLNIPDDNPMTVEGLSWDVICFTMVVYAVI